MRGHGSKNKGNGTSKAHKSWGWSITWRLGSEHLEQFSSKRTAKGLGNTYLHVKKYHL
jgi:hypothetical protein